MSSKFETKLTTLNYSNFNLININFMKTSLKFLNLPLYRKKFPRKQDFTHGNSAKLCDADWKFLGPKPRTVHENLQFCLVNPQNFTSFLTDHWNFHMFFNQYPWKFHILHPCPCLDFFCNNPFWVGSSGQKPIHLLKTASVN